MRENFSLPLRFARLLCVCTRQAWARVRVAHVRMRSAPACVPWCVSREGGQSSGACCGCGASRMSGVARRRASMPVCVHASLPPSLLGRPSVIGYREARPCQARVVRTLYSCEARRWVHGTQRGEGSCARCVRTMRIMLCYVMLRPAREHGACVAVGRLRFTFTRDPTVSSVIAHRCAPRPSASGVCVRCPHTPRRL